MTTSAWRHGQGDGRLAREAFGARAVRTRVPAEPARKSGEKELLCPSPNCTSALR